MLDCDWSSDVCSSDLVRGELIFDAASQMLMGDVNADGMADFQLLLSGVTSMTASDIWL
jgi:hypothetical protein